MLIVILVINQCPYALNRIIIAPSYPDQIMDQEK